MRKKMSSVLAWAAPTALVILYALVLLYYRGNFELTRGDGVTIMRARAIVEHGHFLLYGGTSSVGIPTPPYAIYLHTLAFLARPSISGIQLGILLSILLTHLLVLLLGSEFLGLSSACLASLLLFFSPPFFVFYNQKFWQPVYLPLFVVAALYLSLRYVKTGNRQTFIAACFVGALCAGFHYSALLLLPVILAAPVLRTRSGLDSQTCAFAAVALLVGLGPFTLWCTANAHGFFALILLVCAVPFAVSATPVAARRWLERGALVGLPLVGAFCLMASSRARQVPGISGVLDFLPAMNDYTARHIGLAARWSEPWSRASAAGAVSAAYFAISLWNWKRLGDTRRLIFLWTWVPAWLLVIAGLRFEDFPHQWLIFVMPGLFLGIASLAVADRGTRAWLSRARLAAIGILAVAYCSSSIAFAEDVQESGGAAWHFASLDEKFEILSWIYSRDLGPKIMTAANPSFSWYDYGTAGWSAADQDFRSSLVVPNAARQGHVFYIYEMASLSYDPALTLQARRAPTLGCMRLHHIVACEFEKPPGIGGVDASALE